MSLRDKTKPAVPVIKFALAVTAILIALWAYLAVDSGAEKRMTDELKQRAFTDIAVIDHPSRWDSVVLGNLGGYSAKVGNCRVTITTSDGRPIVKYQTPEGAQEVVDADMTKIFTTPGLGDQCRT